MPNRILRDWTDSDNVNKLSAGAEIFFTRLIMKADDFGCFYSDVRLLKAHLFPLKLDIIIETEVLDWVSECVKAGLILLYEVANKKYLEIVNFKQRLRTANRKFPAPPTFGGQSADNLSTIRPPEVETKRSRNEVEVEGQNENVIYSKDKTKELFFADYKAIEYAMKEKGCDKAKATGLLQRFWDKQEAGNNITTRSYSDFMQHFINSVPKMEIKQDTQAFKRIPNAKRANK